MADARDRQKRLAELKHWGGAGGECKVGKKQQAQNICQTPQRKEIGDVPSTPKQSTATHMLSVCKSTRPLSNKYPLGARD